MISAISHLLPTDRADYAADVADILDAAHAWQAGHLDLNAVMQLGTIPYHGHPSRSYSRFVAVATTPPGDPRRAALLEILRRVNRQHGRETPHGMMSRDDDHQHDAAVQFVRGSDPWEPF